MGVLYMKIIVFGATGGVGQHVVKQAIEAGHEVTAFVRTPEKLEVQENVTIIQGDAFNKQQVADAIVGHEAVVSCLASSNGMKPSTELEQMSINVADGMEAAGVSRFVYCASAGVYGEIPGLMGKLVMRLLKNALKDHRAALDYYQTKSFTYTIARPMGLKNEPLITDYREAFEGVPPKAGSIPRASVAHFMVKALNDSTYENTSVAISK
jgi:nucleoside-diphosphate-sugar epimerase